MANIVDCCRVWESHRDVETESRMSADRRPARAVCQVTVDEQIPTASPETETLENIIRRLLLTPVLPAPRADPIPADQDLLIQRLLGTNRPTEAGGTGAIGSNGIGNHVTECINSFRPGMFFVRSLDPYDGKLPDS